MAISGLVARSLTRVAIPELFRKGLSASAAASFMRTEIGGFYRRQTFLADWRELTGVEKVKESFKFIPKKYRLSFGLTVPRVSPMATNFQYLFRVTGKDVKTGELTYVWTSMLDDVRMSPARAEEIMKTQLDDPDRFTPATEGMEDLEVELFAAFRDPGFTGFR